MKLIFILLVVYLAYYVLKSIAKKSRAGNSVGYGSESRGPESYRQAPGENPGRVKGETDKVAQTDPGEEMVLDPVCSSYVPLSAAVKKGVGSKAIYYCSKECMEKHDAE